MFVLKDISRAHSSGSESCGKTTFETLEMAVEYIVTKWYDGFCVDYEYPEMWDAEDMGIPFPTKEEFTKSVKEKVSKMKGSVKVFGPYSQYCCLVPNEITLYESK